MHIFCLQNCENNGKCYSEIICIPIKIGSMQSKWVCFIYESEGNRNKDICILVRRAMSKRLLKLAQRYINLDNKSVDKNTVSVWLIQSCHQYLKCFKDFILIKNSHSK